MKTSFRFTKFAATLILFIWQPHSFLILLEKVDNKGKNYSIIYDGMTIYVSKMLT